MSVKINSNSKDEIICTNNCPLSKDCANHESALDIRRETGSRPIISMEWETVQFQFFCDQEFEEDVYGEVTIDQIDDEE